VVDGRIDPLMTPAAFLIVGACVLPLRAGPFVNALQWRPLALLGVASYSLYMWHYPILDALHGTGGIDGFGALAAVGVAAIVAAAAVSYAVIESPFLRLRRQWARSAAAQEPREDPAPAPAG
jgi:peptidoglycan/LPS O-acetylase OafA/YrhL